MLGCGILGYGRRRGLVGVERALLFALGREGAGKESEVKVQREIGGDWYSRRG